MSAIAETEQRPALIQIDKVSKTYVRNKALTYAIEDISFAVPAGEVVAIVGPSGSGKSTLLNMIAGLLRPTSGVVRYSGAPVAAVNTKVGYMTQHDTLLPWRTALANVRVALEIQAVPRKDADERARKALADVGLEAFAKHYPTQLSGGMRKRVQLARTVVYNPQTLLMDEPFGALDAILRVNLQQDFLRLLATRAEPLTVVLVTHDLEEAVTMADQVIVLSGSPARVSHVERLRGIREAALSTGVVEARRSPEFGRYLNLLWNQLHLGRDLRGAGAPELREEATR
ncbi:ABC transporter ATP-binding protein [Dactylosporangium sp. CA-092794]|uniref:ABC transporter ATP-binding protein n=1 Tax=Dactylosporangium sp. CA-092794 TaxID=3239929 RepID=UPI003D8CA0C8